MRSILNFAPTVLVVPPHVSLRKVDLSIELQILSFYQQRRAGPVPGSLGAGPAAEPERAVDADDAGRGEQGGGRAHAEADDAQDVETPLPVSRIAAPPDRQATSA